MRDDTKTEARPREAIQKWGTYDEDEAAKDKREVDRKGKFYKIKGGRTQVRFLPPKLGQKNPFVKTFQHFVALEPGDDRTTVVFNCPKKMQLRSHCPLCTMADKKRATGRADDKQRAYDLYPKLRVYSAVIVRSDEAAGVQIMPFGQTLFAKLISIREDGDYTHPLDGFDITISKEGTTRKDTEYDARGARKNTPLTEDSQQLDEWLDQLPDLSLQAYVPTEDEVNAMIDKALSGENEPAQTTPSSSERGRGEERSSRRRPRDDDDAGSRRRQGSIDTEGESVPAGGEAEDDLWGDQP